MTSEHAVMMFGEEWAAELQPLLSSEYMTWLETELRTAYKDSSIIPEDKMLVFEAFRWIKPKDVSVILVGTEPYIYNALHTGVAYGLPKGELTMSAPMKDIHIQLEHELSNQRHGMVLHFDTTLRSWSDQGVLLLNASPTVKQGQPGSHAGMWANFIQYIIQWATGRNKVILTLDSKASTFVPANYINHVNKENHSKYGGIITCDSIFMDTNQLLKDDGHELINWTGNELHVWDPEPF